MKDRLPLRQVQALQEFSVNGQSVRTSEQELVSFVQLLKSDDDPTSDAVPCVAKTIVIVSDQVDTMVGEAGLSREEQSKRWIELMRAYSAKFKEGELVVDTECDPMSLCVSTRLPVYVNKILSDLPQKRK